MAINSCKLKPNVRKDILNFITNNDAAYGRQDFDECTEVQQGTALAELEMMSEVDVFDAWCKWTGFIGYTHDIIRALDSIRGAVVESGIARRKAVEHANQTLAVDDAFKQIEDMLMVDGMSGPALKAVLVQLWDKARNVK